MQNLLGKKKEMLKSTGEKKKKTFAHIKLLVLKAVAGVAVSSIGGIIHPGLSSKICLPSVPFYSSTATHV